MPIGIAGLLVAAILAAAMSNLSAALNSLSSTTVVDFYIRLRPEANDRERGLIARSSTVLWALVLFAIALYSVKAGGKGHVVEIGLSIASVAYGCLLGVFLLGTLTRFATEIGASLGMIAGFALNLWLWQGTFPMHLGPLTIPHIAFTWYVLIGALATFLIGAAASLLFRKQSTRHVALPLLLLSLLSFPSKSPLSFHSAAKRRNLHLLLPLLLLFLLSSPKGICFSQTPAPPPTPDFSAVSAAINTAIAAHKLPGAVVLIGHNGEVVFHHAYGLRKLAGEPGPDGTPSPAEPMTEDTLFDMASLTKCLATATAIMQLDEAGTLSLDAPVQQYLPAFNPPINGKQDPQRAQITLRNLLMHTSGEPADVNLRDPWGLSTPDRAEGFHRAESTPLQSAPNATFRYSDINFILLGEIVEKVSGQREDDYVRDHIFKPLGMTQTGYHALDKACGADTLGAAIVGDHETRSCAIGTWYAWGSRENTAPTEHDDESKSNPAANPNFDHLLRGTVHDPTTRRMGGVAGQAGVFSTAADISRFAQALLDRLAGRPSNFPLTQRELLRMTTPAPAGLEPGNIFTQNLDSAGQATLATLKGQPVHALGWDINTAYSRPRGALFATAAPSQPSGPQPSFGHTGYTGTSLWMDPATDTYVILLANAIHPRGNPPISQLRQDVATAAAAAFYPPFTPKGCDGKPTGGPISTAEQINATGVCSAGTICDNVMVCSSDASVQPTQTSTSGLIQTTGKTLTGLDALEADHFTQLTPILAAHNNTLRLGLLTNQTGLDAHNRSTADILFTDLPRALPQAHLVRLFTPEHGLFGQQDTTAMHAETDTATGLPVTGLYGAGDAARRPQHDQLKDLDAVVIDLQDAGVRFYTYETVLGYFLEAAAREATDFHHSLSIIVLDRPNPLGGLAVQGPVSDPGHESYTDYTPLPVRHGLTLGELARYDNATNHLNADLTVVPMRHWTRDEFFAETGLPWTNPSPNLRSPTEEILYPGLALLEGTNMSVGRGTSTPFELFGAGQPSKSTAAPWFHAAEVATALNALALPGVHFAPITATVAETPDHYPYHGQTIEAVHLLLTDPTALDTPAMGIAILSTLHRLYPTQFDLPRAKFLIVNQLTMDALQRSDDPKSIPLLWQPALQQFIQSRKPFLLY